MPAERHTAFTLSKPAAGLAAPPIEAAVLRQAIVQLEESELAGMVRSYIRDRIPAAFDSTPMLWEALRHWAAARLDTEPYAIGVTGSAQVGFSCTPDKFGRKFISNGSDLDFFVVDDALYERAAHEITHFCSMTSDSRGSHFHAQIETLRRQACRGFADLNNVPADHKRYPNCSSVNNLSSMIVDKLKLHAFHLRRSHFRVYQSWNAFWRQTLISYQALRTELCKQMS